MTQKADNLRVKRTKILLRVQRFTVVDNSDFSPSRLTGHCSSQNDKKTILAIHFQLRGFVWLFMCSCSCW